MKTVLQYLFLFLLLASCHHEEAEEEPRVATPVTIISPERGSISDITELTAVSTLLKKEYVKAPVAGYVVSVNVNAGDMVKKGKVLFTLQTKEAAAIGTNKVLDSLLRFSGVISIRASKSGRLDSIGHQRGDYVQEGELLAQVTEGSSLAFVLNVPFALMQYVKPGSTCDIVLPDGKVIQGIFSQPVSAADAASQTLGYFVKPVESPGLPENLAVKVLLTRTEKQNVIMLPKSAVLSNETLTEFWVMKLLNDSTAVKVPVKTGIENDNKVEITEPVLKGNERILLTGQYGLADTALVMIEQ